MKNISSFDAVRISISQGDTAQALSALIGQLQADPAHAAALRASRVLEASYQATRQQQIKGILPFQEAQREYNRINDGLLAILDGLENGPAPGGSRGRRPLIIGAAVLVVALLAAGLWWLRRERRPDCPEFRNGGLKVLVLPFQNIGHANRDAKPEVMIQSLIRDRAGSNQFPVSVEVLAGYDAARANPDIYDAKPLAQRCGADLVVWGNYDYSRDSVQVDARFAFAGQRGQSGGSGFQAFPSVANMRSGRITKSLDDAVFSLCALMAVADRRLPLAKKWLEKLRSKDERDTQLLEKMKTPAEMLLERKPLLQRGG